MQYLRNFPGWSPQSCEPLLSNGLSNLSFLFRQLLPFWFPADLGHTRMHFDESWGPSIVSVTRNLNFSLKKLCTAWSITKKITVSNRLTASRIQRRVVITKNLNEFNDPPANHNPKFMNLYVVHDTLFGKLNKYR